MIKILAALDEGSVQWDAQKMGEEIQACTGVGMLYKRVRSLQSALERMKTEERWEDLRFLVVSYQSIIGAIDPNAGTISSVSPLLHSVKSKFEFKRYPLVVIGISPNDMFGSLLSSAGCDITCSNDQLQSTVVNLSQPGSGNLKLPR